MTLKFKVKGQRGRSLLHNACAGGNVSLVQKLMLNYEHLSPLVVDEDGNTPLHLCAYFGHSKCVEVLLLSKAPVPIRNANGKAPIDLAKGEVKVFLDKFIKETQLVDYDMLQKHAKNKYSGSEHITRIFVIENPGAGKSSLIESLKREGYFQHFISESIVPPHTSGIIPNIHVSKHYGRVLFYDFAGDPEYYSSHAAILEKLASLHIGSNIFFLVADLRKDDSVLQNILHYWFSFIQYQNFSPRLPSLIVIGSHADLLSKNVASDKCSVMEDFVSTVLQSKVIDDVSHFMLDCCRPGSKQIGDIQRKIKSLIQDSPQYSLSLEESILLGIFEKDFSNVISCPVSTIVSHIHLTGIPMNKSPKGLYPILEHLQNVGILFVVVATRSFKADTENCVTVFSNIVNCVMEAKTEFCHATRPKFFLLDSNSKADYLVKDNHFAINEADSVLRSSRKSVVVSITGKKNMERSKLLCMRKLTYWNSLFPIDITSVLHYLKDVVRELYHLGLHLKIAEGKLDAIDRDYPTDTEKIDRDYPTDTEKRRRELVKERMNSSLEPPCWCQLVEALNKISRGVLAEEIEQEHSEFIGIRVSLYIFNLFQ